MYLIRGTFDPSNIHDYAAPKAFGIVLTERYLGRWNSNVGDFVLMRLSSLYIQLEAES
jgi:hypothetical protein